ncbi:MAG: ATP-dependent DNA helicase RecQ [Clostridiales bacterium]|jgi:ATP-dependent DNA helicase RecQ|nr:ATP-dependent DNA helicase RecQ [Clostridiales bacterium]
MDYTVQMNRYLKKYFGYDDFLLSQQEVIQSILEGNNTLAIFPTGGGKSLCYQLPALIFPGTTIVISPLISLMKDQVDELIQRNINAAYISSVLPDRQITEIIRKMKRGQYKIVYIAPERFYSQEFLTAIKEVHVPFVAVDEAHCISQWGHNFRPAYLKIRELIEHMGNPILAAFTATATKRVQEDIMMLLGIEENCNVFVESFDRPNLHFKVEESVDKKVFTLKYIRKHRNSSGIIYTATRASVEELWYFLKNRGIAAGMYHAGLDSVSRNNTQEAFLNDEIKVMVATNAFGMGINKSDVRYIIHWHMPKSMEHYYQEAGRAGRDGKRSSCILLHSKKDYDLNRFMIDGNYPSVALVESLYKRIKAKGDKGIPQQLLIKSRTIDKHVLQSALRKLFEYDYVKVEEGIVYSIYDREFELTQQEIDWHKEIELDRLDAMEEYSKGKKCLRRFILEYFNEKAQFEKCGNCSVCNKEKKGLSQKALDKILEDIFGTS